jgi:hypothetical protein
MYQPWQMQPKKNQQSNVYWQEWFGPTEQQFNIKLFAARKIAEHTILDSKISESHMFYSLVSLLLLYI